MAIYNGSAGNDNLYVGDPSGRHGETATWNGLGGIDTLIWNGNAPPSSNFKFTLDANGTSIHLDSVGGASTWHYTLNSVEKVQFSNTTVDLTKLFSTAFGPDVTAPTVKTFSPADAALTAAVGSNIVLTFNEAIQKGTGLIEIHVGSATGTVVESYDAATSANLMISGSTLTINPTADLAQSTQYFVTFAAGTVKDIAGNSYAGTTIYDFTTADTTAPTVSTFSPADAATSVAVGSNIVLTFSEAIQKGTGLIEIHAGSATGTVVASYNAATSANLTISGSTLTINPTADLAQSTHYFVTFAAGSIKDIAGNNYAGTTVYDFTTVDTTAPTVTTFSPTDAAINVAAGSNIVLTFSEAIQKGVGLIEIHSGSAVGAVVESYDAATSGNLIFSGTTLTINPTADLAGSTQYFVTFAAGSVKDLAGNSYAGTTVYDFTTIGDYTVITGTTGNDSILTTGTAGKDQIFGLAGNDTINGGLGADTMTGGLGNDTYVIDNAGDLVTEASGLATGIDTVQVAISSAGGTYTLTDNVENGTLTNAVDYNLTGNSLVNKLIGNASANVLEGGAGVDTLIGLGGNDTYNVNLKTTGIGIKAIASLEDVITEAALGGTDTVVLAGSATLTKASTLVLGLNLENLDASGTGTTLLNLTGNALANTLTGNDAANILNGAAGADTLVGGLGDDTYIIDNALDVVTETSALISEIDTVQIAIASLGGTYTLGSNIENGTLTNKVAYNLTGNSLDNVLTGNAAANTLTGDAGNDTLNGGVGNDTLNGGADNDSLDGGVGIDSMNGGDGDDTYVVNVLGDIIVTDTSGTDLVKSAVTYSLVTHAELENLTLTGIAAINATGNDLNNTLLGNAAANILNGGLGADAMAGGLGNDTYVVDDVGDLVTEASGLATGIDTVQVAISSAGGTYTLGDNVEKGTLTNSVDYNLTGNALANTLTGNIGNNVLEGGAGVDTLIGLGGNDIYNVNLKTTGVGIATVASLEDIIKEAALGGTDTVVLTNSATLTKASTLVLGLNLENLDASATGTTLLNLTGNAVANILTGNDAANILNGAAGADTLVGGLGDDKLIGGTGSDSLWGDDGADIFVFNTALNASTNVDTINDFVSGTDHIYLENAIFSKLTVTGELSAANFYDASVGPTDANDFIGYNSVTGALYYDANGSGVGGAVQFATFDLHPTLTATDFTII